MSGCGDGIALPLKRWVVSVSSSYILGGLWLETAAKYLCYPCGHDPISASGTSQVC